MRSFDELMDEAAAVPFVGFEFSFLRGRVDEEPLSWDYLGVVRDALDWPLLDMGTGGGEVFSRLAPFAGLAVATEAWIPNVSVAAERLRGVGAWVVQVESALDNRVWEGSGGSLPFAAEAFGLVINRHEAYSPAEVLRVLRPGGRFITQQVGATNNRELKESYGSFAPDAGMDLAGFVDQLREVGFEVIRECEEFPVQVFRDVGAVAWYVNAVSWEFPGFSFADSRGWLRTVDDKIRASGGLVVHDHRLLVEARKPGGT